jgi:hypothetical protein
MYELHWISHTRDGPEPSGRTGQRLFIGEKKEVSKKGENGERACLGIHSVDLLRAPCLYPFASGTTRWIRLVTGSAKGRGGVGVNAKGRSRF